MDLIVPEVESVDTVLVINPDTRVINVGSGLLLGVETDNDAERVKFQCPKIVGDNLDLSQYHIYIHYQNAKGETGKYLCEDVEDAGENITFSWLLSQKVTVFKGATKFLVCAKKTDAETIVWNTTLASGNVLEGLAVDEDIVQQNDDVIEQILLRLERIEDSGGTGDINNAKVTFTEAEERTNIESQETMSTIFGKIKKWFSDLKTVAFTGSYNDLSDKPKKLPNPYKLKFTGAVVDEYDGSVEKTINIPEGGSDYILPQARENTLGGIKAKAKTTETVEAAIDTATGKIYVPTYPESSGSSGGLSARYDEVTQNIILEETGGVSGGGVSSAYELIAEGTLEEEAKQMAIGGNLDEYGIVYFYVKIESVATEYYNGVSWSETSNIDWHYVGIQNKTPINRPYFYRGRYFIEKNRAYCEWGGASQYDNNARIFRNAISTDDIIPKYLVVFSNDNTTNLPVGTHAELWGVKKNASV